MTRKLKEEKETDFIIKETVDDQMVSNHRYFFSPSSLEALKFEKELDKRKIQYIKNHASIQMNNLAYSFFEKDIEIVNSIFNEIEKESLKYEQRKKKKRQKISPKTRQKKIAVGLLLVLLTFILISLIL